MAPKLRTVLLTTAVASGILLSSVPAQAQVVGEEVATREIEAQEPKQLDGGEPNESPPAPVVPPVAPPTPAVPDETIEDSPLESSVPENGGPESVVPEEVESAVDQSEGTNEPVQEPSVIDEGLTADPSIEGISGQADAGPSASPETGSVASVPAPIVSVSAIPVDPSGEVARIASTIQAESSASATTESVSSTPGKDAVPSWFPDVSVPEGSEAWDEKQWNEFLETEAGQDFIGQAVDQLMQTEEFGAIADIIVDFIESGDEGYLDELMDYLNGLFPENPEWAQEIFDGIMLGLIEGGVLDPGVSEAPEESEESEGIKPIEKPKPEIKPAGNINKPTVDKKPIATAVIKPMVSRETGELAQTGANGSLILAGSGGALLLAGAAVLVLRRNRRAH